jgi:hypothetical protein
MLAQTGYPDIGIYPAKGPSEILSMVLTRLKLALYAQPTILRVGGRRA